MQPHELTADRICPHCGKVVSRGVQNLCNHCGLLVPEPVKRGRSRRPVARVASISAVLWVGVGLSLGYVAARLGAPAASGFLALLTGPVVFAVVGRRYALHGSGEWVRAAVALIVIMFVVVGVSTCGYAMLLYG
jgi:hypothetical protein